MIRAGQLRAYASASMPQDNTTISGGVIDRSVSIDFSDLSATGGLQVVSSDSGDSVSLTIYGRLANGVINSESVSLNGTTPAPTAETAWERIMKAVKSDVTVGDVAVEQVTAVATGTLQDADSDTAVLDLGASTVDGYYVGFVFRVTGGTGVGSIAKVLVYDGSTQTAVFDKVLTLNNTSVYRLSRGVVLNKSPYEIMTVRRPFWNALATAPSGADRVFYEKFFWRNDSAESLTLAQVQEVVNTSGILFGIDPTIPSTSSVVNRLTAPVISNLVFGRLPQDIPTTLATLAPGQAVGVWLAFAVSAGQTPRKTAYMSRLAGQTT